MSRITLTVRRGSRVSRERFDDLEAALAALRREAEAVSSEGSLPAIKALRDFEPGDRVAARLEISTGGLLRGRSAGLDVMGDGSLVAYCGGVGREPLEPRRGETAFAALRRELGA